jgi:SAM-dependent methyltransferase
MVALAEDSGSTNARGVTEAHPLLDRSYDTALVVTTVCFVDDVDATLREARRILRPDGQLLIGYIDKESRIGRQYQQMKDENPFYRDATFVATDDLLDALESAGFGAFETVQTIFELPDEMTAVNSVRPGHGDGSFVAIRAEPDP